VEVRENALIVSGRKKDDPEEENRVYLHRGIAQRAFERRFHLAEHVRVIGATLKDGMLHIDLKREVPEALKPRRIEIVTANGSRKADEPVEIEAVAVEEEPAGKKEKESKKAH